MPARLLRWVRGYRGGMPQHPYAVVGGGPAGGAAARALAAAGTEVVLLTDEDRPPYDRTVLSTELLLHADAVVPEVWPPGAKWRERIDVRTRTPVVAIDPVGRTVTTAAGENVSFAAVLLAPGAEPRRLTVPGADGPGVHHLRDTADALSISHALGGVRRLVVVGGGVIGLEVAAAAATRGVDVEVVEAGPRVLGRGVPAPIAGWIVALHEAHGVRVRPGAAPDAVQRSPHGAVTGVRLHDGTVLPAEAVVVGIGIEPREHLARTAGIACDDGILVDASGRTSHPAVFAAGDAVRMRRAGEAHGIRLESFSAAGRQGEVAAHTMLGGDDTFTDVPWWWSDQYDATLQSIGVAPPDAREVVVGTSEAPLVLSLDDGRLMAACGVGHGPGIARPVRAAGLVIAAGGRVDLGELRTAGSDPASLTAAFRAAAQAPA